jgi:hypothetical protein
VEQAVRSELWTGNVLASPEAWELLLAVELGYVGAGPAATALSMAPEEFEAVRKAAYGRCAKLNAKLNAKPNG